MNPNHEAFSPESNNPRLRRAFAHAMVAQVAEGADVLPEAQAAVEATGDSRKSLESGFGAALINATETGLPIRLNNRMAAQSRELNGLPVTATDEELAEARAAKQAAQSRELNGLPVTATDEELAEARKARMAARSRV